MDDVPGGDILFVLGDFNARVGTCSEQSGDGLWRSALGSFVLGERNAAGDRLLLWCAMNQFSILNTFFQKPDYKRGTMDASRYKKVPHDRLCSYETPPAPLLY